jgi:hypothetical protein
MRLLERAIEKELHGVAEMSFEPGGVRGSIDIPLQHAGLA